jgi:hypothetical protein
MWATAGPNEEVSSVVRIARYEVVLAREPGFDACHVETGLWRAPVQRMSDASSLIWL